MTQRVQLDGSNYLEWRSTPWDQTVLGVNTNEIISFSAQTTEKAASLLMDFEKTCQDKGCKYTVARLPSNDQVAKQSFQLAGYQFVECSLLFSCNKLRKKDFTSKYKTPLPLVEPTKEGLEQIKNISKTAFNHGRFFEDPLITEQQARQRNYNWIEDMISAGKDFLVYKKDDTVYSFLVYSWNEKSVDLVLAGSNKDKGLISPYFWASFMQFFKEKGVKKVTAMVSASNLIISNLYVNLNFQIENSYFGFRKER